MSEAQAMYDLYVAAEKAVLLGKSYTIGTRTLTRADLPDIRAGRNEWQQKLANEQASSQGGSSLYSLANFTE